MKKLRFIEENKPWKMEKLGSVLSIPIKSRIDNKEIDKNKLITVRLHMRGVQANKRTDTLKLGSTNYYPRKAGQFIYGKQNLFNGAMGIVPPELDGYSSSQDIPALDIDYSLMNEKYFLGLMGREIFYKNLASLSTGTGSKRISEKTLFEVEIPLPSLPEQEKIGGFFSALDEEIERQSELVDLLALEYKGYSQQIFSQKLRFKDENGADYPEWEEKKLGELASSFSSNISFSSLKEKSDQYKTPVYTAKGIEGYSENEGHKYPYISVLKDGAGIGRVTYCKPDSLFISTLQGIKPNNGVNILFIKELLIRMNLAKYKVGSGIPHVYFKEYSLVNVGVPSLPEQEKIGGFLSSLSDRLESEKELLIQLKEQKKAYLQKLLP